MPKWCIIFWCINPLWMCLFSCVYYDCFTLQVSPNLIFFLPQKESKAIILWLYGLSMNGGLSGLDKVTEILGFFLTLIWIQHSIWFTCTNYVGWDTYIGIWQISVYPSPNSIVFRDWVKVVAGYQLHVCPKKVTKHWHSPVVWNPANLSAFGSEVILP